MEGFGGHNEEELLFSLASDEEEDNEETSIRLAAIRSAEEASRRPWHICDSKPRSAHPTSDILELPLIGGAGVIHYREVDGLCCLRGCPLPCACF